MKIKSVYTDGYPLNLATLPDTSFIIWVDLKSILNIIFHFQNLLKFTARNEADLFSRLNSVIQPGSMNLARAG